MYRPTQPHPGYPGAPQYPGRQPPQRSYYDPHPAYYAPQQLGPQYRAMPQQYPVNYAPYSQYQPYQKPVPMGYQPGLPVNAEPWQREPMRGEPLSLTPRREKLIPQKPAAVVPPKPDPRSATVTQSMPPELMLRTGIPPGGFDVIGRGNLPSIAFQTAFETAL